MLSVRCADTAGKGRQKTPIRHKACLRLISPMNYLFDSKNSIKTASKKTRKYE